MLPWFDFLIFSGGIVAIVKGADWFTEAAVWFADKTGIPKIIIGATIVSLATTLPEFAVSSYASFTGHSSMAVGNAVGSAICNIGLVLGLTLLLCNFQVERQGFVHRSLFMIGGAVVLYLVALDGVISRADGGILLLLLAGFIYYTLQEIKTYKGSKHDQDISISGTPLRSTIQFIVGAALVVVGSRLVVSSGIVIAEFFNIPEIIIALTLIALGTSLPELVTAITATLKGYQALSIGNIVGANILNITWVIGGSALVGPLKISAENLRLDFPVMALLMVALLIFGLTRNILEKWEGATLLIMYTSYIGYIVITSF